MQTPASTKYHHFHFSPSDSSSARAAGTNGRGAADVAGGAIGATATGAAIGMLILTPAGAATRAGAGRLWAMISLAAAVPSAPHTGQATGEGIRPPTGSTSNA